MIFIFFGPPGAGKGTYADALSERLSIPHVSTGDILRNAIHHGTKLGEIANAYVEKGELVPDEIMIDLISERISQEDAIGGFILDGFPRTVEQAVKLDGMLKALSRSLDFIFDLDVDDEEVVRRLSHRLICRECNSIYHNHRNPPADGNLCRECGGVLVRRDDDKEETVRHRLDIYKQTTAPVIDYYKKQEGYRLIDSNVSVLDGIKSVFSQIGLEY
jgi:adenylate kinase